MKEGHFADDIVDDEGIVEDVAEDVVEEEKPGLTPAEVGELLNMDPKAVRRALRTGKLKGTLLDKRWYIDSDDVQAYSDALEAEAKAKEGSVVSDEDLDQAEDAGFSTLE